MVFTFFFVNMFSVFVATFYKETSKKERDLFMGIGLYLGVSHPSMEHSTFSAR